MATGIPRTRWQTAPDATGGNGNDAANTDVRLAYECKKSREEILRTLPAVCRQLWPECTATLAVNGESLVLKPAKKMPQAQ